ncbi:MAG: AraC family transcriptional regulator [Duganella sp.]
MATDILTHPPLCPPPLARAPRAEAGGSAQWLCLAPAALQGALVALVGRDTRALKLDDAQRLTHFPASPMVTLSWFDSPEVGMIAPDGWQRFGAQVVIAGSQSQPTVSWSPVAGRGYIACFTPDAAQVLFGVELAAIQNRFVPVAEVLDARFAPLWTALLASEDGAAMLALLEQHLAPRWQTHLRAAGQAEHSEPGQTPGAPARAAQATLRQVGRHWIERLAWKVHGWRNQHSARHVERRIKSFSGRSLREWQALSRTESLFFAARDRYEAGQPFDWSTLALDEGFSDQAHMSCTAHRISGFAPGAFAQRFIEDESFWLYRLWV